VSEQEFKRRPVVTPPRGPLPAGGEGESATEQGWCIAEVLAHLLWSERRQASRIAAALAQDGSKPPRTPEARAEAVRAGRIAPVPQLVHGLLGVRREIERLLTFAGETEAGLERRIVHSDGRAETVLSMVEAKIIDHEAEHAAQIEAIRASMEQGTGNQEQG
jgi:hypothetical protein